VEHPAQCRTLGDLPVEMLPPSQLNQKLKSKSKSMLPLYLASVVQTAVWQTYQMFTSYLRASATPGCLSHTGLIEPWRGAGETWGWPMLVIDAGTALTLTVQMLIACWGAILPGVFTASVSGSTNRWLTACRNRRFGVSTALGFEYNRGDSEWCYLQLEFYSGMAAGISRSCITLTGAMAATADVSSISVPQGSTRGGRPPFNLLGIRSMGVRVGSGKRKTDTKQI